CEMGEEGAVGDHGVVSKRGPRQVAGWDGWRIARQTVRKDGIRRIRGRRRRKRFGGLEHDSARAEQNREAEGCRKDAALSRHRVERLVIFTMVRERGSTAGSAAMTCVCRGLKYLE